MPNILDKKDRSLKGGIIAPHLSKADVYSWYTGSPEGEFSKLDKRVLNVEGEYQRDAVSQNKIHAIARNWDWALFGTLDVSVRDDSTYWVYDGGHRLRASFYRSDVLLLPCMVHRFTTLSDEAKAFVARNTMISNVKAIARFKASLVAGEPLATQVNDVLGSMNLRVSTHGDSNGRCVSCVGKLLQIFGTNAQLGKRCLELCEAIAGGDTINSDCLGAIFALSLRFAPERDILVEFQERFSQTSQAELLVSIRKHKAIVGKGGDTIAAKGLIAYLNKGLRSRKLSWE